MHVLRYRCDDRVSKGFGNSLFVRQLAVARAAFLPETKRPLFRVAFLDVWLREPDLNRRPSGYEPDELPDCSIPRLCGGILQPNAEVSTLNPQSMQMISRLCRFCTIGFGCAVFRAACLRGALSGKRTAKPSGFAAGCRRALYICARHGPMSGLEKGAFQARTKRPLFRVAFLMFGCGSRI